MDIIMDTPEFQILPEHLKLISEIDEFKGKWQMLRNLAPDQLSLLKRIATIESIGSSTRIEGAGLTDSEVERLLSGLNTTSFESRDEAEVAGYAEAMEMIFESYDEIQISENHIKQLHQVLLRFTSKDARHRGEYKKLPNHVEAFAANGRSLGIIFETAPPFDTPFRMKELIQWFSEESQKGTLHPLLLMAIFIVHFLAIHPFQDGNGRLSRILTTLLLMRSGYSYVPFSSLERIVEENKDRYYLSLRRAQSTLYTNNSKLNDWLLFFLGCLRKQIFVLDSKVKTERMIAELPPLSQEIMKIIRQHGRARVRDIQIITGANRNTIKAHIKRLVERGELKKMGAGRGTWYRFP
ncbi:MAG: Fic family protein [Deltaproteobacteria bacterium]|nr:Fic family protein [Deltaproteobacteria bacterium]MBW2330323.1 Fic family protein [Deltaproteobacteria bacterium]